MIFQWGLTAFAYALDPDTGIVYTFGGRNSSGAGTDAIFSYNPHINLLEQIGTLQRQDGASAIWSPDQHVFYIFGGWSSGTGDEPYRDVRQFDPVTRNVTRLPVKLPGDSAFDHMGGQSIYSDRDKHAYLCGVNGSIAFNTVDFGECECVVNPLLASDRKCVLSSTLSPTSNVLCTAQGFKYASDRCWLWFSSWVAIS